MSDPSVCQLIIYHTQSHEEKAYDIQIFTDEFYFLLSLHGLKLPSIPSVAL